MNALVVTLFVVSLFYFSKCAHIHGRMKKEGDVPSLIEKVDHYIREVENIMKDVEKLEDHKQKKGKKKDKKEENEDLHDMTGIVEEASNNPVAIDEKLCKEKESNGKKCDKDLKEGDIRVLHNKVNTKRVVPSYVQRWTAPIYYRIEAHFSSTERSDIEKAIAHFNSALDCSKTVWKPAYSGYNGYYVRFQKSDGCWSYIGSLQGQTVDGCSNCQPISIGDGCFSTGTIIHEMMHCMGFAHEQSRSDRDNYVRINYENIKPGMEGNFKKVESVHSNSDKAVDYDYKSIMHYQNFYFTANGERTLVAINKNDNTVNEYNTNVMGTSQDFTKSDIYEMRYFYKCDNAGSGVDTTGPEVTEAPATQPPQPVTGDGVLAACDVDASRCHVTRGPVPSGAFIIGAQDTCGSIVDCNAEVEITSKSPTGVLCYDLISSGTATIDFQFLYSSSGYNYVYTYTINQVGTHKPILKLPLSSEVKARIAIGKSNGVTTISNIKVLQNC